MKNITISVTDDLYHQARVKAAERRTTITALVRSFLEQVVHEETRFEQFEREHQEVIARILEARPGFAARERLTRDELHDRHAVR